MVKDQIPADNPTIGLFDLAEQMSDNYHKIQYIKYYAYVFVGITLLLLIILGLLLLAQGNFALGIIFFALTIIFLGILYLGYIIDKRFLSSIGMIIFTILIITGLLYDYSKFNKYLLTYSHIIDIDKISIHYEIGMYFIGIGIIALLLANIWQILVISK